MFDKLSFPIGCSKFKEKWSSKTICQERYKYKLLCRRVSVKRKTKSKNLCHFSVMVGLFSLPLFLSLSCLCQCLCQCLFPCNNLSPITFPCEQIKAVFVKLPIKENFLLFAGVVFFPVFMNGPQHFTLSSSCWQLAQPLLSCHT